MATNSTIGNDNQNKKIIQWGVKTILSHGYQLKSTMPEEVQNTPWSHVVRFLTTHGVIYLKNTPDALALEAPIIRILYDQFDAPVAEVIAHNAELNCFLMKDAGKALRVILKKKFDETLVFRAIDQFTSLQLAVAERVDVFLDMGVPDWRLEKLPDLYRQLLLQKDILIADGLSEIEISQLKDLFATVVHLCQKLSSYFIKHTLVQPDLNDNNTLIDDKTHNITIIDLGEIAISHPFFSLFNFLHVIKKYHDLTETSEVYLRLKDYCFKKFIPLASEQYLLDAISIARPLFFVYAALGNYRLMQACDKTKFTGSFQRHGRISPSLKELMAACL
ncbi:MAG: hypothetical protein A3F46_10200 [Legionellales bacterium RIFCSPHIGHO2_12_FULL_42_9]|nr:MAG: hypothetical protein A3F46_10200 [Legionellales bacterium RIFCSPHIGHO2_12_FULL_42_9]